MISCIGGRFPLRALAGLQQAFGCTRPAPDWITSALNHSLVLLFCRMILWRVEYVTFMGKHGESPAAPDVGTGTPRNGHEVYSPARDLGLSVSRDNGHDAAVRREAGRNPVFKTGSHRFNEAETWARIRKLALRQLNRMVSLESKVLRDDFPEAVHDLRVASRRLQSLLDLLYPDPRPPQIRKLRRRLRQVREALGELRNQDVLMARMGRVLARKRAARREAWKAAHDYVLNLRPKTVQRAHRQLARLNLAQAYVRLRHELTALAERADSPASPPSAQAAPRLQATGAARSEPGVFSERAEAGARFARRLGELWKEFEELATQSRRDEGVLHPLRIATKRVRYLVEIARELDMAGSAEVLGWLRDLQGRLGDWHDLEIMDAMLIEMLARRKFLAANLPLAIAVEKLILSLRASKTRQCQRYLRIAFQVATYRQMSDWVIQSAALRPPAPG